ncbi:hypothetical protein Desaci_1979 [Desulfosporosinus acidiphilus SJ4]|uniref:Uncharacterized protein n=1 Tax=Desulfosporosinus acidiphilus (strain DSM 22704 / JCM 16185 / SJ4) TaxID=646529 RepID=I4D581_DESAJ|nr:hypothetical protein [Desulfosporosinus acidiphilus]AFM40955.1 hypothetical protein Desaci_1979 [Desulfosporosinus acidiphilus SJ4]
MLSSKQIQIPKLTLESQNLDSWSTTIKGFLISAQHFVLNELEKRVKRDDSSSPIVIAGIRVIKQVLPCPVERYRMDTFYILRLRLGKGAYEYNENTRPSELFDTMIDVDSQWNESYDPRSHDVWIKVPKGKSFEKYFNVSMLQEAIESLIRDEQDMLIDLRGQALSTIGFRPLELRIPSGEPDKRIKAVTRIIGCETTEISGYDLVSDMQKSSLLKTCPDEIEQVMHRARLLYVNAYYEWEFFTISVHYAVLALEASLRALYDEWLGAGCVEVSAEIEGKQVVERVYGPRENILNWANGQKARKITVKGAPFPRNKPHLLDHAVRIGALSLWEKERCSYLLHLRDVFSHPKGTFTDWISWASGDILESSLWINLMWARFYRTLPYEFAWKKKPIIKLSNKNQITSS